jgi:hypothetical protein
MVEEDPPEPIHVAGTQKGEELVHSKGREPGRDTGGRYYRTARDSTGLNAKARGPIDPRMPEMPPA